MDLTPNADQEAFRTATADWCRDNMPLDGARARSPGLWKKLEVMGWVSMTTAELGLDHATEALVFAELGRFLAPVGLLASATAARWVGVGKMALALPSADHVRIFDAEGANEALGLWGENVGIVKLPAGLEPQPGLDLTASLCAVEVTIKPNLVGDAHAKHHLQLLAAAFSIGCADAARDMAADYAKIREQFDRPIGWFQSLKHICSDMAVRCAVARSQLYYAACALDAKETDAAFHIAAAKRLSDEAALENGRANIQVHGGIGMTDEAYPHYCMKRAHLLSYIAPVSTSDLLKGSA